MKRVLVLFLILPLLIGAKFRPWSSAAAGGTVVGVTTIGGSTTTPGAGLLLWGAKFTAPASGNVTSISIYSANTSASLKIKVGIYSDSAGAPNLAIGASPIEFTPGTFSAGWKQYSGFSIPVTSGSTYWITADWDTASAMTINTDAGASGVDYFYVDTYTNTWPLGSSASADTSTLSFQAFIQ